MRTVALVGLNGSIDWFCFPRFDSPSIFASILDDEKGGHFKISPIKGNVTHKQLYWPDTNVLITRFLSSDGVGEVTDYMPVGIEKQHLVRSVSVVTGSMTFRLECMPAFNYARDEHETHVTDNQVCFYSPTISLGLVERAEKENAKMISGHFPAPGFGSIVRVNGRRYWQAL